MDNKEEWIFIKDYDNKYMISSHGRIKSLKNNKEKILKLNRIKNGYIGVSLYKNGKVKNINVHRLVALHFIPNPDNKYCVNHLDFIRSNNNVKNLEWCTQSENIKHAWDNDRFGDGKKITKQANEKCSKKVLCIELNIIFNSSREAGRVLNIDSSSIIKVCKNKRKYAGNYQWRYV